MNRCLFFNTLSEMQGLRAGGQYSITPVLRDQDFQQLLAASILPFYWSQFRKILSTLRIGKIGVAALFKNRSGKTDPLPDLLVGTIHKQASIHRCVKNLPALSCSVQTVPPDFSEFNASRTEVRCVLSRAKKFLLKSSLLIWSMPFNPVSYSFAVQG